MWVNWGIFNHYEEESVDKIFGPSSPYVYGIDLTWSDFYDRPLILYLYLTINIASLCGILAAPISILPVVILQLYVFSVPIGILINSDVSSRMTPL